MKQWLGVMLLGAFTVCAGTLEEELVKLGPEGGVLTIEAPCRVENNVTVPANVTVAVGKAGVIELGDAAVLTIDGALTAPARQIFKGAGKVTGRAQIPAVLPQWFGAAGDGKQDDAPALNRAAEFARTTAEKRLLIPSGRYKINSPFDLRCNVDCFGVLVKEIEIDESKTTVGSFTRTPDYKPKTAINVRVLPDEAAISLDGKAFAGIRRGAVELPAFAKIARLDRAGETVDLTPGGTLFLRSTDFASARNNRLGDEYYAKFDCFSIVSPRGGVMPEAFYDFNLPENAPDWDAAKVYKRGDYCRANGKIFKATYPSGPGTFHQDKFLGKADVGPTDPAQTTRQTIRYAGGKEDGVNVWIEVTLNAFYVPPQTPIAINGLSIEVSAIDSQNRVKPIADTTMSVTRSGVTINNLKIVCTDRNALLSSLLGVGSAANITFNDAFLSGATYHGLGYNILNTNVANVTYNNCVSVNCRDAMAGNHGKNVTINGGRYFCIDDHYGMNYIIRGADVHGISTRVPGYCSPAADVSKWDFAPRSAFVFAGGNIDIANCRVYGASGIFGARSDIGDLYGSISIADLTVEAPGDVQLFALTTYGPEAFDYAHEVRIPARVNIRDVVMNGPGRLTLTARNLAPSQRFPIRVSGVEKLGVIDAANTRIDFIDCGFDRPEFRAGAKQEFNFTDCEFNGAITGLKKENIGKLNGCAALSGANLPQ